jgi:hypothetical protein
MIVIPASQCLLEPSNGLAKGSFVPRLDLRHLQIRSYTETVSRPYALSDLNEMCSHLKKKSKKKCTHVNRDLIVNVIGVLLLLLEYGSGRLDIFVLEVMVVY